jgi:hypothetical protein
LTIAQFQKRVADLKAMREIATNGGFLASPDQA